MCDEYIFHEQTTLTYKTFICSPNILLLIDQKSTNQHPKMSEEPTFSLTCDEHQPDFEDLLLRSSEEEKPPNNSPKQTTLDSLLSPLETPNGTDRPELEYPDRHSPQLPACETPHSSKRTLVQRRSKKRTHSQQELPTERALPPALLNWTCAQELWDNLVFKVT